MSLPIDLLLIRHGQSESNMAKRRSRQGDVSDFTPEFIKRPTSQIRLTEVGREQARVAGEWLRNEFTTGFDRCFTSNYARAMETAGLLSLPNAEWLLDFYLTERSHGELDMLPEHEREIRFGKALEYHKTDPFFWRPPNGESIAGMCLRVDRVLHTLHRECRDKRVILVCHGEIMWGFRIRIERMSSDRFRELRLSKDLNNVIFNCQIIHYTRRDPTTGRISSHVNWMRMIRPTDLKWGGDWQNLNRKKYTNQDLIAMVSKFPAIIS